MYTSFFYWHPKLYESIIDFILGSRQEFKYKWVSSIVKVGESILDFGCGTGRLKKYLPKKCSYVGVDLNPKFLFHCIVRGINVIKDDLLSNKFYGRKDNVVLIDIVHHVFPNSQKLIEKAMKHAKKKVIICDMISNRKNVLRKIWKFIDSDGLNRGNMLLTHEDWKTIIKNLRKKFFFRLKIFRAKIPFWNLENIFIIFTLVK
jgi:SAM-dependent methyltransferase